MKMIKKILESVKKLNPYKIKGNHETYTRYNEGFQDAIGVIEGKIDELEYKNKVTEENAFNEGLNLVYFAKWLHDTYEESSKIAGWDTQKVCKVEFEDLPEANKAVMYDVSSKILENHKAMLKAEWQKGAEYGNNCI